MDMKIKDGLGYAFALGTFDGVHLGHQFLIRRVKEIAAKCDILSAVYTFGNVPRTLNNNLPNLQIMSSELKKEIMFEQGVDKLVMVDFDETLKNTEPEDFVADMCRKYGVEHLVVGKDFRFGRGGRGTPELLSLLSDEYHYSVDVIDFCTDEYGKISSSRVRKEIESGELDVASKLLGRPYIVDGLVEAPSDFAEFRFVPSFDAVMPKEGVYSVSLSFGERILRLSVNIAKPEAEPFWYASFDIADLCGVNPPDIIGFSSRLIFDRV